MALDMFGVPRENFNRDAKTLAGEYRYAVNFGANLMKDGIL